MAHEALFQGGFNIIPIHQQSGGATRMAGKSTREGLRSNKNHRLYRLNRQHEAIAKIYGLQGEKSRSRNRNIETTSTNQNLSSENSCSQRENNSLNRDNNRFSISHIQATEFEVDRSNSGIYNMNLQQMRKQKPNSGAGFRRSNMFS